MSEFAKSTTYIGSDEPENPVEGDLWISTKEDLTFNRLTCDNMFLWNGSAWVSDWREITSDD